MIHHVITKDSQVVDQVKALRKGFCELHFCFQGDEYTDAVDKLHQLLS
jgi:hypothetical protein